MARKKENVTIVAKPHATKAGQYDFHMEDDQGRELLTLEFSKDKYPGMKKNDDHEVHFELVQQEGMTLEFAHSLDDVLWVEMGDEYTMPPCPKKEPNPPCTIFYAEKSHPRKMIAVNTNPARQKFSFTINFVDSTHQGPKKLIPFDPGGSNQNGGEPPDIIDAGISTNVIIGAIAGVALLAVGFMILR